MLVGSGSGSGSGHVKAVSRAMCRESSVAATAAISSAIHRPVAQRYWKKSRPSRSAISESLMVIAVIGPVGRSTRSGCAPTTACSMPKRLLASRYSERPMRLGLGLEIRLGCGCGCGFGCGLGLGFGHISTVPRAH